MTLILSGTNGVSDIDGDASTPAIRGTDANTGMFFGTDIVGLSTGGSERMRIDSSGNVGIGTTSPTSSWKATIQNTATIGAGIDLKDSGGTSRAQVGLGAAGTGSSAQDLYINANSNLLFNTAATERMRIDSSGNVGIGTSSPVDTGGFTRVLDIQGTVGAQVICRDIDDTTKFARLSFEGGATNLASVGADGTGTQVAFRAGGAERARITSGGEVYIAGTTDQGAYNLQCNGTGVWGAGAYVNGSDERIKDDIAPIESGLDVVTKLNPVTYRYKEDWSKDQSVQTGFIAQELLVALEGQNYVDGIVQQGGSEGYYSVAYQNIIPLLTKAIQEQQAIIESLKSRIEALETK